MKSTAQYGLLAKVEASYNAGATLAGATDGVDLIARPQIVVDYMHNGERRGKSPASHGGRKRVGRMGRFGTGSVEIEPCGAGAAYSSSVLPNVHAWMRAAGHTAAIDTTADAETVTYTPHAVGAEVSLGCEAYDRKQKYVLNGALAEMEFEVPVPGLPLFKFALSGTIPSLPVDAAVPSITYPSIEPPKAEAVTFTVGDWVVGNIKEIKGKYARNLSPRLLDNTTGLHGGWNVGAERTLTLEVLVEATALKTASPWSAAGQYNHFASMEAGEVQAISFTIGGVQYNITDFEADNAQLVEAPEEDEENSSLWRLKYECKPSTLVANDEWRWIFR